MLVFLAGVPVLFWLHLPVWVATSTAVAFLLYIFILGLVFVLSFRKEPFTPNNTRKLSIDSRDFRALGQLHRSGVSLADIAAA